MNKRVNITLPTETIQLLERVAPKGERSRLISEAIAFYVEQRGAAKLRQALQEGAQRRAARDLALAQEWFELDVERP